MYSTIIPDGRIIVSTPTPLHPATHYRHTVIRRAVIRSGVVLWRTTGWEDDAIKDGAVLSHEVEGAAPKLMLGPPTELSGPTLVQTQSKIKRCRCTVRVIGERVVQSRW
jgi:hypothetical protein